MKTISPITTHQQSQVVESTNHYIDLAGQLFSKPFEHIPVNFKLTGRAAGMYHVKNNQRYIRYNPYIFSKYFEDNLNKTVPHEVAHYIADDLFGIKNIRPHGKEWRDIMLQFGLKPEVRCNYDLTGIPIRTQRRFTYRCHCRTYDISTRRHNMILNKERSYYCSQCRAVLSIA